MQVVFKHSVCSLFSVSTNPSSAMTTLTSPTKSEVPTSRTGQKEKSNRNIVVSNSMHRFYLKFVLSRQYKWIGLTPSEKGNGSSYEQPSNPVYFDNWTDSASLATLSTLLCSEL